MTSSSIGVCGLFLALVAGITVVGWAQRGESEEADEARISRALAEQGNAKAQLDLGTRYYYGRGVPQDYGEAARWYRKAADQGDAKAQFDLGSMFHDGKGVPQDFAEAVRWCRKAAEQEDPKAQSALGYAYCNGQGVPQEYAEAVRWYRKAADHGYSLAQQALAYMYATGQGVQQDDTQAVVWYRKAAEQGDAVAQRGLGYMYANGRGVPLDRTEAQFWYRKAAEQGDLNAKTALDSIEHGPRPPTEARYIELSAAALWLSVAFWFFWGVFLQKRTSRNQRHAAVYSLIVTLLLNAGLSLYAFSYDIRYSPHRSSFQFVRAFLVAIAILMIVTVISSAKKRQTN
jgi:hypothetical protein